MTNSKHTRTPWQVHAHYSLDLADVHRVALGHQQSQEAGVFDIFTDDGRGNGDPLPLSNWQVDATHIVRCVNAHDELVAQRDELAAALAALCDDLAQLEGSGPFVIGPAFCQVNRERARAALAKVEG